MSTIKLITVTNHPEHAEVLRRKKPNRVNMMYFVPIDDNAYRLVRFNELTGKRYYKLPVVCGIYEIVSPTGKVYVGQSRNIFKRWGVYRSAKCKDQRAIYNSLIRHGSDTHIFKIIKQFDSLCEQKYLDEYERNRILLNSSKGYELLNLTTGGFYTTYCTETRNKISQSKKGKKHPHMVNYWKGKTGMLHPNFGRVKSPEEIAKQSATMKAKYKERTLANIENKKIHSENYWNNIRRKRNLEVFAKQVIQLTPGGDFLKEWESTAKIERELGICHRTVKKYCLGQPVRYGKHNFIYKSDYEYKINNGLLAS